MENITKYFKNVFNIDQFVGTLNKEVIIINLP